MRLKEQVWFGSVFAKTCGDESDETLNQKKRVISLEWQVVEGFVPILD